MIFDGSSNDNEIHEIWMTNNLKIKNISINFFFLFLKGETWGRRRGARVRNKEGRVEILT
jgi:hypothetical protein